MAMDDIESSITSVASRHETRRSFLRHGALAAFAGTVLAACKPSSVQQPAQTVTAPPAAPKGVTGTDAYTATANVAASSARAAADEMDKMHEAGLKAFPAKTSGKGNELLTPRMDGRH